MKDSSSDESNFLVSFFFFSIYFTRIDVAIAYYTDVCLF